MRIDSGTIGMKSERSYSKVAWRLSKFTMTEGRQKLENGTDSLFGNLLGSDVEGETTQAQEKPEDYLPQTLEEMKEKLNAFSSGSIRNIDFVEAHRQIREIKQQCLNYLIELLFPSRHDSMATGEGGSTGTQTSGTGASEGSGSEGSTSNNIISSLGVNVRTFTFSRQYYYEETEMTSFSTKGTVKCADGREIEFNLNMDMSRSFQEYYEESYSMKTVSLCDPLVINLEGNIADLSDQTFFFDIDADGEKDEINRLSSGSGYLALDKNNDGTINDGSELFGTASGNGFADLAAYDTDQNGFIDEGDAIWSKLKIWTMDEKGKEQLCSLSEKGVGAICLANTATDFAITGEDNGTKGMIRKTGFFLYENGAAGSVQHVDVAKYSQTG